MAVVNIEQAKTQLSRLLSQAEAGDEVVIARHGKPVARLVRLRVRGERRFGAFQGSIDVDESFFDPLPEAELANLGALNRADALRHTRAVVEACRKRRIVANCRAGDPGRVKGGIDQRRIGAGDRTKYRLGRLPAAEAVALIFAGTTTDQGLDELAMTVEDTVLGGSLPFPSVIHLTECLSLRLWCGALCSLRLRSAPILMACHDSGDCIAFGSFPRLECLGSLPSRLVFLSTSM